MGDGRETWEFTHVWRWTLWSVGVHYEHVAYDGRVWTVGLGPVMLVWFKGY